MPRRAPALLTLLASLLLLALLLPLARAANSSSPFAPPLPLLRQQQEQRPSCLCECRVDLDFKTNDICPPGSDSRCVLTRCFPRTEGFGCCDSEVEEAGVPLTGQQLVEEVQSFVSNVELFVRLNPEVSREAADILDQCIFDLEGLNDGIIPDQFVRTTSRSAAPSASWLPPALDTVVRMLADRFFRLVNNSTIRVLRFVVTELRSRLRRRQ